MRSSLWFIVNDPLLITDQLDKLTVITGDHDNSYTHAFNKLPLEKRQQRCAKGPMCSLEIRNFDWKKSIKVEFPEVTHG